ncbi:MAG TPA: BON domain-containing protein [Pirellulaceae bacterium]|nr:BON domain-containing protein [Pirellulaceae bacterium]
MDSNLPTDLHLEREVRAALSANWCHRSLRSLAVWVDDGVVTLRGQTGSFYEKQIGLSSVQKVSGISSIVDEVSVLGE